MLLVWYYFFLYLLLVVFVQETESILHANGVAEFQALVVLSKVLRANPHFLIFLCCSWNKLRQVLDPRSQVAGYKKHLERSITYCAHLFALFGQPTVHKSECQTQR